MIHRTSSERINQILRNGLMTDMGLNMTDCGVWSHVWYGKNPIFLANPNARFLEDMPGGEFEVIVDVTGLDLVADLPSLCDIGGHVDDGIIWWKEGREPPELLPFLDEDGGIEIEYLIDSGTDVCRAAIAVTRTAACLSHIPPDRITMRMEPQPLAP